MSAVTHIACQPVRSGTCVKASGGDPRAIATRAFKKAVAYQTKSKLDHIDRRTALLSAASGLALLGFDVAAFAEGTFLVSFNRAMEWL